MKFKPWNQNDELTEMRSTHRLFREERRVERKAMYIDKNGEVVRYLPTEYGYLVVCGGEILAKIMNVGDSINE